MLVHHLHPNQNPTLTSPRPALPCKKGNISKPPCTKRFTSQHHSLSTHHCFCYMLKFRVGIYSLPNFVVLSWDLLTMLEPLAELPLDYIDLKALPLKNVILLPFATAKTISDTIYLAILPVCSFASNFIVISKVIQSTYLPTLELLAICLLPFSDGSHGQVRFVLYTKTRRTSGYQCNLVLWEPSKVAHQTALLAHGRNTWRMPDTWPVGIMKGIRGPVSWKWLVRLVSTRHFLYWDLSDN